MITPFHITERIKTQYTNTIWNEQSGLSAEEIENACRRISEETVDKPYVYTKLRMISFVLENARLEDNPDDIFADKLCHKAIIERLRWEHEAPMGEKELKEVKSAVRDWIDDGSIFPGMDFGHTAPDWDFLMQNGISGTLETLKQCRADALLAGKDCSFYDNSIEIWETVRSFILRLENHKRTEGSVFCADNLKSLADNPPQTLAQAMHLSILMYNIINNIECAHVRSLGRIDRMYYPFYCNDLASGRFTENDLRELTKHFLYKISVMGVIANLPMAICGTDPVTGKDVSNDFTKLLIEEYDKLDIYDPKFHVLCHDNMRQDIFDMVLEMVRKGHNSFVFINPDMIIKVLTEIGIEPADARNFILYGCYEPAAAGTEVASTVGGRINLPKAMEYTLAEGDYKTFVDFYQALKNNIEKMLLKCMDTIAAWEPYYEEICPVPMISGTIENCRKTATDFFHGGAKYNNTSIVVAGTASLTDMVTAVKRVVFDNAEVSLDELRKALSANWKGYESLQQYCANECPKYGCGNNEADDITVDLCDFICDTINHRPNGRGGVFRCGMFSIDWCADMGSFIGATPDGRFAGEPISKNFCANLGKDKNGVTALINSAAKIDYTKLPDGAVMDIVLHSSATSGEEGLPIMKALISSYFLQGGMAIQMNILNGTVLRLAQKNPENYQNLQVRLCGWNVRFVDLSRAEQDHFIYQAEHAS